MLFRRLLHTTSCVCLINTVCVTIMDFAFLEAQFIFQYSVTPGSDFFCLFWFRPLMLTDHSWLSACGHQVASRMGLGPPTQNMYLCLLSDLFVIFCLFFFSFLSCVCVRLHLPVLRIYSQFCNQGSLLVVLRGSIGCSGLNINFPCAQQVP